MGIQESLKSLLLRYPGAKLTKHMIDKAVYKHRLRMMELEKEYENDKKGLAPEDEKKVKP